MDDERCQRLVEEVRSSPVLTKLNEAARELTGNTFALLLRREDDAMELDPAGGLSPKPEFCQLMDRTAPGRKICATCRTLVAFSACYQGLTEQVCHGGVSLFAAPACDRPGTHRECIVVVLRAFAAQDRATGWRQARAHSQGSSADLKQLRNAYDRLPAIDDEKRRLARALVDVAAASVCEIERGLALGRERDQANQSDGQNEIPSTGGGEGYGPALLLARDPSFKKPGETTGSLLVDMVKSMVNQNPGLPHSVDAIARAARITPNHFSMLFRRHAGQPFIKYLTDRRINLAKDLLRNLNLTIAEVASQAGFSDAAYFARRFRKMTGATPSQWRTGARPPAS